MAGVLAALCGTAPSAPVLQDPSSYARARTTLLHNSSVHKVAVPSSLGRARQFPRGHVPTTRCWTIPEMGWLRTGEKVAYFQKEGVVALV